MGAVFFLDIWGRRLYNINRVGENVTSIEEYSFTSMTLSPFAITGLSLVGTMHYSFDSDGKQFRKKYIDADGNEQKYVFEYQDEQNVAVQLPTGVVSHAKSDHFGRKVFDELQLGGGMMNRKFSYYDGQISDAHIENDKRACRSSGGVCELAFASQTNLNLSTHCQIKKREAMPLFFDLMVEVTRFELATSTSRRVAHLIFK